MAFVSSYSGAEIDAAVAAINTGATESTAGVVEFATSSEVAAADGTTNDTVVRAKHLAIKTANNHLKIGDLSGNTGGNRGVTISPYRTSADQVAAGNAVAIGARSKAGGSSVAIGYNTTAANSAIVVGYNMTAPAYSVLIGINSVSQGSRQVVIGDGATANSSANYSVVIGKAYGLGLGSVAIGGDPTYGIATATRAGQNSIAIGSTYNAGYPTYLGGARAAGKHSIAIGTNTLCYQDKAMAIGYGSYSSYYGMAIGLLSSSAVSSIAIGPGAEANYNNIAVIGQDVTNNAGYTMEIGKWSGATRNWGLRFGNTIKTSFSVWEKTGNTSPADGSVAGSESASALPRGFITFQVDTTTNHLWVHWNQSGNSTVRKADLGLMS